MLRIRSISAILGIALLWCGSAQAVEIIQTYSFYAVFSSGPYTSVSGMFDLTYSSPNNAVASDFSSTLSGDYQAYSYTIGGSSAGIGNNCTGLTCQVRTGSNEFSLSFQPQQNELPSQVEFSYSSTASPDVYAADLVTFSLAGAPRTTSAESPLKELPAVPLPASAPLFGAALAALGVVGYRLKRTKGSAAV